MKILTDERYGFVMIVATLLVIGMIAWQFIHYQQNERLSIIQAEGRNAARLLSNLSYHQLMPKQVMPKQGGNGILDLLKTQSRHSGFAYAAIVDLQGQPLAIASTGEASIAPVNFGSDKNMWISEYELNDPRSDKTILEFRAPVLNQGELAGYIRVGYFKPGFNLEQVSFLAQMALPVFLLVPLAYVLIRRELKPLKQASIEINKAMHKQHIKPENGETSEFHNFTKNFQRFVEEIDQRFQQVNEQNFQIKASGLALTYQRQRTEVALRSIPDAILVLDENGKPTFANAKVLPLLGVEQEQIIGQSTEHWCLNTRLRQFLSRYQTDQLVLQAADSFKFHPDNNPELTIMVSTYPLFSPKEPDAIIGTLVVFRDETAAVMASQARDQFISHVAHELKSPLNIIHLYAESLLETGIEEEQRIDAINVINDEVERLSNLIANLLNISKIEAGSINLQQQRVKLHEFLTDTFESVARSGANQQINFQLDLPRTLPDIILDKDLLRIALNNILTNAVKYNKPGGMVSMHAEESDERIIIKISDTGLGIAPKDQGKIFEKFYRADDDNVTQRGGHGLGLALAMEIIQLHHGSIGLESELGQGSEFTVFLKKTTTFLN